MIENTFNIDDIFLDDISIRNASVLNKSNYRFFENEEVELKIEYEFTPAVHTSENQVQMIITVEMALLINNEPLKITGNYEIYFTFEVAHFTQYVDRENTIIHPQLLIAMANIAYSTSRGIIYSNNQGTILANYLLPIVSNEELIKMFGKK